MVAKLAESGISLITLKPSSTTRLSFEATDLNQLFSRFGTVKSVSVFVYPGNSNEKTNLPFGIVVFSNDSMGGLAELAYNNYEIPALGTLRVRQSTMDCCPGDIRKLYAEALDHESSHAGGNSSNFPAREYPLVVEHSKDRLLSPVDCLEVNLPGCQPRNPWDPVLNEANYWVGKVELIGMFGIDEFNLPDAILGEHHKNIRFVLEKCEYCVTIALKGILSNQANPNDRFHISIESGVHSHWRNAITMVDDLLKTMCINFVSVCTNLKIPIQENMGYKTHIYTGKRSQCGTSADLTYIGSIVPENVWIRDIPANLLTAPAGFDANP